MKNDYTNILFAVQTLNFVDVEQVQYSSRALDLAHLSFYKIIKINSSLQLETSRTLILKPFNDSVEMCKPW